VPQEVSPDGRAAGAHSVLPKSARSRPYSWRTSYDAATFLPKGQHIIANLAGVMPVLLTSAAVLGVVVVVALFGYRSTVAAWPALSRPALLGAVIVVTLAVEVAIDNRHHFSG
jgi:hypothetical protein